MMADIAAEEWDALAPENFDTTTLLRAVDAINEMRSYLVDGENGEPPELRTDLLRLHRLAMAVFNQGARGQVGELFETAVDVDDQVDDLMASLKQVQETLSS